MALHTRRMGSEDWRPVGVGDLEDNALIVVRSVDHRSVIAGPGAGKTELLAQRAAYLLQTGVAKRPRRILAISFKRDAATNLAARVAKRCHPDLVGRLDSLTFDAFAKSLLDRFGQALPELWRPRPDYQILETNFNLYRDFLQTLGVPPPAIGARADIEAINVKPFERDHLLGKPLPVNGWPDPNPTQWAAERFWQKYMRGAGDCWLSFPMIGRLVELLLRASPMARSALRLTYSHVFMDEFQDTTQVQYDLVRQIFLGSDAIVTAVGDNKQQIMRWALAMDDPFTAFEHDFKAVRTPLYNNYRSSPDLVRIQHVLAQALDAKSVLPISKAASTISDKSCAIWDFTTSQIEAASLAAFVAAQMKAQSVGPRDFVIIVRQKADDYAAVLGPAFAAVGLPMRNEAAKAGKVMLQELLTEELSTSVVQLLRLATSDRAGRHWSECQNANGRLQGVAYEDSLGQAQLRERLDLFCKAFRADHPAPPANLKTAKTIVARTLDFIGRDRLIAAHPAYRQGGWFEKVLEAANLHLLNSCDGAVDWVAALDAYEGTKAVPLMTIHKSKGLEYHTVIFVGLDDRAWWSFAQDTIEATAGFFVAFTRARQRVIFTYCSSRGDRKNISALYQLLQNAGVVAQNAD
jgi:superfamily I DNA/RNA helicase